MHLAPPLVEELSPIPDSWEIARAFAAWPHLVFFDSSERHPQLGRYSFISADPTDWLELRHADIDGGSPFARLQQLLTRRQTATIPDLPPFQGGLAGLFGYGLAHAIERFPRSAIDEFEVPGLAVGVYDWVIAFDHAKNRAWLIAHSQQRLAEVRRFLGDPGVSRKSDRPAGVVLAREQLAPQFPLPGHPGITSNFTRNGYLETIRRAVEYVHAGDCFQVNIAQRLLSPLQESPLELYGRLRERNPAPFAGYFDLGQFAIASASPERFLRVHNGVVESRPIKGTRPRDSNPSDDARWALELAVSAKDRAENVMIVDLVRNDLGRVCEFGTVTVPVVCGVETYRYVHHLVSVVTGRLRENRSPIDLLRATFPGGSVTGAPKVRAMEIISELEPIARGAYCGSLGYIGFDGAMDANILIRTFTAGKGWSAFPVGGGIVADSDPEREYQETLHKAEGMLRAL
jgi:para-aminobenzoate synthetase component I